MTDLADRPLKAAMIRGLTGRCPRCGQGQLLRGYLTVRDHCPACGEALHHQRADDGPAYLTILVVGHLMAPALLVVYTAWQPPALPLALGVSGATIALSLLLLPRFKGVMVAIQWAKRMHGFGAEPRPDGSDE